MACQEKGGGCLKKSLASLCRAIARHPQGGKEETPRLTPRGDKKEARGDSGCLHKNIFETASEKGKGVLDNHGFMDNILSTQCGRSSAWKSDSLPCCRSRVRIPSPAPIRTFIDYLMTTMTTSFVLKNLNSFVESW